MTLRTVFTVSPIESVSATSSRSRVAYEVCPALHELGFVLGNGVDRNFHVRKDRTFCEFSFSLYLKSIAKAVNGSTAASYP